MIVTINYRINFSVRQQWNEQQAYVNSFMKLEHFIATK